MFNIKTKSILSLRLTFLCKEQEFLFIDFHHFKNTTLNCDTNGIDPMKMGASDLWATTYI